MTDKNPSPGRRKIYIVSKKLQRNFTLAFLFLGFFVAIFSLTHLWYLSSQAIDEQLYRTHLMASNPWEVVYPVILKTTLIFLIVLSISSIILSRIIFKRHSRKLERFNRSLAEITGGDLSTPVPDEGIESLNLKLEETRTILHRRMTVLMSIQKEIKEVASSGELDEKRLKDLESLFISFKNRLSKFKY